MGGYHFSLGRGYVGSSNWHAGGAEYKDGRRRISCGGYVGPTFFDHGVFF